MIFRRGLPCLLLKGMLVLTVHSNRYCRGSRSFWQTDGRKCSSQMLSSRSMVSSRYVDCQGRTMPWSRILEKCVGMLVVFGVMEMLNEQFRKMVLVMPLLQILRSRSMFDVSMVVWIRWSGDLLRLRWAAWKGQRRFLGDKQMGVKVRNAQW